jgi:hypothetical protein
MSDDVGVPITQGSDPADSDWVAGLEKVVRQTNILIVVFIATALILAVSLGFSIWTATCQP